MFWNFKSNLPKLKSAKNFVEASLQVHMLLQLKGLSNVFKSFPKNITDKKIFIVKKIGGLWTGEIRQRGVSKMEKTPIWYP